MKWVVTVGSRKDHAVKLEYTVEAETQKDAEASGYRAHCASPNAKHDGTDCVTECKAVGG